MAKAITPEVPVGAKPAVVMHHGLVGYVLEAGHAPEYRLYVLARERLHAGVFLGAHGRPIHKRNGVIRKDELVRRLEDLPNRPLGNRRNIRKVLQCGEGVFWDTEGASLRFPAPDRLARRLGLPCAGHRLTAYPVETFERGIAAFRDVCRDALQPSTPRRLSRAAQAQRLHTSASTQKRREANGKALYHDGTGIPPVGADPQFLDFTTLAPGHVGLQFLAQELVHEGFFARANRTTGQTQLLRQAPKTYQSSAVSKRRKPNSCTGHRPMVRASGGRLVSYNSAGNARLVAQPSDEGGVLELLPRGAGLSLDNYLACRPTNSAFA